MADGVELHFVSDDVTLGSVRQFPADPFTNLKDLVDKSIAKLKPGKCIKRLIIAGHGAEHTEGHFTFDVGTNGADVMDGGTIKGGMESGVRDQLQRLRPYFCPDAVIEMRVCQFGGGENGKKVMQALADATGVAVTAPLEPIKVVGLIGGLATQWRTTYPFAPKNMYVSFWRAVKGATVQRPIVADIAPITAQYVPLPGQPFSPKTPPPGTPAPTVVGPPPVPSRTAAIAGAGAVLVGAAILAGAAIGRGPATPASPPPTSAASAPATAASATAQTAAAAGYRCVGNQIALFDNSNGSLVAAGGSPPTFSTNGKAYCLLSVSTYHWNSGRGATPGRIGLLGGAGNVGPVQTKAGTGVPNADWVYVPEADARPLLLGQYTCTDSDPSTWSQNDASGRLGFCRVFVQNAEK